MVKKLARYIGQYKRTIMLVPIFVLLDVLCELSMPLLMSRIIDVGIADKDVAYIGRIGIYMVLLALAAAGFGVMMMRLSTVGSMGFGANLRNALFAKVQAFSFTNIDQFSTASLITRLTNDVSSVQMTLMMGMRMLVRAPVMLITGSSVWKTVPSSIAFTSTGIPSSTESASSTPASTPHCMPWAEYRASRAVDGGSGA